jgi:hypothetical protein
MRRGHGSKLIASLISGQEDSLAGKAYEIKAKLESPGSFALRCIAGIERYDTLAGADSPFQHIRAALHCVFAMHKAFRFGSAFLYIGNERRLAQAIRP